MCGIVAPAATLEAQTGIAHTRCLQLSWHTYEAVSFAVDQLSTAKIERFNR